MHVLGMPPAFVLSQDQTLRLTSDPQSQKPRLPLKGSPKPQDRKPKTRIPSLHALPPPQNQNPPPAQITSRPQHKPSPTAASRNTPSNRSQAKPSHEPSPKPPPAHPFSIQYLVKQRPRGGELPPCAAGRPYTSRLPGCQTNYDRPIAIPARHLAH